MKNFFFYFLYSPVLLIRFFLFISSKLYGIMIKLYLRSFDSVRIGRGFHTDGFPKFRLCKTCRFIVGDNFKLLSYPQGIGNHSRCNIRVDNGAVLSIGKNVGISNTVIMCFEHISIGDYVNIGDGTLIMDTNFHSTFWKDRVDRKTDIQNRRNAPIHIGDYTFIGANCIICKGVSIGEKSIVAAGSVVVKDIPNNEVWGGNPARFIKKS